MDPDIVHMHDCVDDGEMGAGRKLLFSLIDDGVENTAIFVVRYHRGPNIGCIHFDIITEVAKDAIKAIPSSLDRLLSIPQNGSFSLHRRSTQGENERCRKSTQRGRGTPSIRGGAEKALSLSSTWADSTQITANERA